MDLIGRVVSKIDHDPIILSHHPLCGRFEDHFFKVGKRYICIGCATVYPSALATVLLMLVADSIPFTIILFTAMSFFTLNLARFLFKTHRFSILFNTSLGISLGSAIFSVVYAPDGLRLVVLFAWLAVAVTFSFLKGQRIFATCRSCERYREFPCCCNPREFRASGHHSAEPE